MVLDIKSYAKQKGVSTQAVYKQLQNHEKALKGHITKQSGKRWLDEFAIEFLDRQSNSNAMVVHQIEKDEAVEVLKVKYVELLEANSKLHSEYLNYISNTSSQLALAEKAQADTKEELEQTKQSLELMRKEAKMRLDQMEQAEAELLAIKQKWFYKLFAKK